MATKLIMHISDNEGYSPDQVETSVTLGFLLEQLENAILNHGEDATVILSNGQRYGAGYGKIVYPQYGDLFIDPADADEDDDY